MRLANSRVRTKVTALIVSLTALWVFAAWVTVRDGVNLLWVQQLDQHVAQPIDDLLPELQAERRLSTILKRPASSRRVCPGAGRRPE